SRLDARNARRARNIRLLTESLTPALGLRAFVNQADDSEPAYYKVGFQYDPERFGLARERFVEALRAEGIAFDEGFRALHVGRSPKRFRRAGDLTQAERAHAGAVVLHHPVLLGEPSDVEQVAEAVRKVRRWAHDGPATASV